MSLEPRIGKNIAKFRYNLTVEEQSVRVFHICEISESSRNLDQNHTLFILVISKSKGPLQGLGEHSDHLILNCVSLHVLARLSEAFYGADRIVYQVVHLVIVRYHLLVHHLRCKFDN
jgi:hypothetical protein